MDKNKNTVGIIVECAEDSVTYTKDCLNRNGFAVTTVITPYLKSQTIRDLDKMSKKLTNNI